MSSLTATRDALVKAYSSSSSSPAAVKSQLTKAKIELTQSGLLVPSPQDATTNTKETVLAREILEIGAFWSLKQKNVESFDRYVGLLRVFYHDLR
jgi:26S proteasome regulatory subunit N12